MSTSELVRTLRPSRRLLLVGSVALAALLSACSSGDDDSAAGDHPAEDPVVVDPVGTPRPEDLPTSVEVTAADYSFELSVDRVAAGPVTVELTNDGSEPHQVHLAKLPIGTSVDDVVATHESGGDAAVFDELEWAGGVAGVEPGKTLAATSILEPGRYALLCFIPTPGPHGEAHLVKGMVAELEVVPVDEPAPEPKGGDKIVLRDYAIDIPKAFDGGPVVVQNDGEENHELVLMRFHEGKGVPELVAWNEAGMPADRPIDFAGGTGTIPPGATAWTELDLPPGDYIALCVVQGPAHVAHVEMGMVAPFTVT